MNRRALLAFALLPGVARAEAPEVLELAGQPVLELARHPAVGPRLRSMAAGRQRLVSDTLRGAGPPLAVTAPWIHGYGVTAEARVFLGFDTQTESVVILLLEGDRPSLFIPPRVAPWPAALRPALMEFAPEMAAQMRFNEPAARP
ncbi:hypothetical protein KTR66_12675 [Roseococcus sp. SDR]|uniref:hypothetical protein n=1 Tax=Roseococcus sp. SDR TaxID=2835532 RepID=UPI001BCD0475|nr:hypothetical protein [Roseococcus sp. SDR]MBS7790858.1 hypothetical protein [Roseococcus sp. SDR]MBV1846172.1 hypothetical protein [Roseococcus sp. SDR]